VVIEIPPDLSAEPDDYRGHDGARRYFAGFDGMIEDIRYEPIELIPVGDRVIAHIRLSGRGVSSGVDVDLEAFVAHELANGKVVRMRPYADRESAEAALT
jgi:ketosteroid isomerase-like protein